jgi:multidrug efflux system membrane fusion protein
MTRKILSFSILAIFIAVLAALVIWRVSGNAGNSKGKRPERPLSVEKAQVKVQAMPILLQAVGQVQPERSVQIRPQVSGMLQAVEFSEGQTVGKGQPLFRIDPATYQASVAAARAAWENARAQQERLAPLAGKDFVTPQEYGDARSAADQAKAALDQAEINLAHTKIGAPIGGRTGSLSVKAGNLVAPTDAAALVSINQLQPILVQYSIPQQLLPQLRRYQAQHSIRIFITNEDGSGDLGKGDLVFVDNTVNPDTGTVMLKARLGNEQEQLWPGQYVGVRTQLALQPDAVVVPQTAIQSGQDGNFVYVVEHGSAAMRKVRVDRQVDELAVIADGLKAGESVVVRAPRNLRPGLKVETAAADEKSAARKQP